MLLTAAAAADALTSIAKAIIAAFDADREAIYEGRGQFLSRGFANELYRGTRYLHIV